MADGRPTPVLPLGTVTFLLTEVERSTWLWEMAPETAADAIARHHRLIEAAVADRGGSRPEDQGEGDNVVAVFGSAAEAAATAVDIQQALATEDWPEGLAVRVRIGLHTGEARLRDARTYSGAALHRCARLRDAAHGGQILLSSVTAALVTDALPAGTWLVDRGDHRLRDLSRPERVFELIHDLGPDDAFPPLRSLDVLPNNLPAQLTSFVGRKAELDEVERLLAEQRLVTLTGSGGCGKTRLAVQAAASQTDHWPDGVWWIDLGPVSDPSLVAKLVASAMGVLIEPVGGPLWALRSQLRDRRLLMCLDTCEHVLDAAAELADAVLRSCPDVSLLATSREPLRVAGELVWRVPSLVVDDAAQLFSDRAALVGGNVATGGADEATVRTVCQRLDGIPLAIELAAAWVRALTPAQIAVGLDDRFRLLVGGPRGAIERHQTLAASMEWSHRLLDDDDRVVFRRLAVFPGSFTLDAAQSVCGSQPVTGDDVVTALSRLVDKSLVVVDQGDEPSDEARYRLLDTIREYADDQLTAADETDPTRQRHLDHYLAVAEAGAPELERDQDTWRLRLEAEHDNLRSALEWGLEARPGQGRRLAAAMARLWFLHGHLQEATRFLDRALAVAPDEQSTLQARLLSGAALVALGRGDVGLVGELAGQGLEIAVAIDDDLERARCLALAGIGTYYFDFVATRDYGVEAQRYGELTGDVYARDFGLLLESNMLGNRDRHAEALELSAEILKRCLPRGERFFAAIARATFVWAALLTGDLRRADVYGVESMEIAEPLGDYLVVGHTISNLAWVKCLAGEIDAGRELMEPLARFIEQAGPDVELASLAIVLGKLHLAGGDLDGAVDWFQQARRYAAPRIDNWVAARALPGEAAALRRLGRVEEAQQCVDRAMVLTRRMDIPHALAEAHEEQAFLVAPADPERAEDLHHQALAMRVERGLRTFYVDSLEALAGLAGAAESQAEAVRLVAASEAARDLMGYPRPAINQ
ncbi:MAG TPA: hypothetical protein VGJ86_10075, partial [Acidimicrobiales bacterium]